MKPRVIPTGALPSDPLPEHAPRPRESALVAGLLIAVIIISMATFGHGAAHAAGAPTITLTLVRHAQSMGNASGLLDTSAPGPDLTPQGWCQAMLAAGPLSSRYYDGVYASTMVRTQETASPTAQTLGEPINVLSGLREIEAGQFEGQPESSAKGLMAVLVRWLQGDRDARIPGSIDGHEFQARFTDAVQHIYDSGKLNPVAFSHGGAIMLWALMNVHNPDTSLLTSRQLPNLGRVVVTGSPSAGWTMTEWDAGPPPC